MADLTSLLVAELLKGQDSYQSDPLYKLGVQTISSYPISREYNMDPWERLAAGLLQGMGGSFLINQAKGNASGEDSAMKLAQAMTAEPAEREAIIASDPKLGKYQAIADLIKQQEQEELTKYGAKKKIEALAEALADPKTRDVISGLETVQERQTIVETGDPANPYRIEYQEVGRGPRFAPKGAGDVGIPQDVASLLAQNAAKAQGGEVSPEMEKLYANPEWGRLMNTLIQQQGIQGRFETDQPTQRKLAESKADAENFIGSADRILQTLGKFNANEDTAGAIMRAAEAGLVPSSEAADLQRMIEATAFESLKPTFPGQLSDSEREAMYRVMGKQTGVTIGKLKEIMERQKDKAATRFNTRLQIEAERGVKSSLSPIGAPETRKQTSTAEGGYKPGDKVRNPETGQVATMLEDGSWEVR